MNISFVKMQGAGNDFVVLSPLLGSLSTEKLTKKNLKLIADRHFGVGADQILIVKNCPNGKDEYEFEIINSDGNQVEQCGNGARCVTRFLFNLGVLSGTHATLKSAAGTVKARILDELSIRVQMTIPKLNSNDVGLNLDSLEIKKINEHKVFSVPWKNKKIKFFPVSMGNPHAVINLEVFNSAEIKDISSFINESGIFKKGINLGFCKILDHKNIELRVVERGSGETLACGSGACAAVVAGIAQGLLTQNEPVEVNLPGGKLSIFWTGNLKDCVFMSGPAKEVFRGTIQL
jgi:diaminopimelate epimerase